jgi:serine O-acetyltransferase
MFDNLKHDIQVVFERDPAARSVPEVLLCYPGLHALWGHRLAHWLWQHQVKLLARLFSQFMRWFTGIEIHPGAQIGCGFFIDHGMGVVIGETAEIGENVTLYHGVTLGGVSLEKGKRHPTLEHGVVVGAGAKVLGPITIGNRSRIGANAVVVKPTPENSVVVGVPGHPIERSQPHTDDHTDLRHDRMPDVVWSALDAVITRMNALERQNGNGDDMPSIPVATNEQIWRGEDFSI